MQIHDAPCTLLERKKGSSGLLRRCRCSSLAKKAYVFERKTGYLGHCAVGQITFFLSKTYISMLEQLPRGNLRSPCRVARSERGGGGPKCSENCNLDSCTELHSLNLRQPRRAHVSHDGAAIEFLTTQNLLMHPVIGIPSTWRHKCGNAPMKTHRAPSFSFSLDVLAVEEATMLQQAQRSI